MLKRLHPVFGLLFVVAFFHGSGLRDLHTPLSHWATYLLAAGTIFHLLSVCRETESN